MTKTALHLGSATALLDSVGSPDVLGLQETKLGSRSDVSEDWALGVPGYRSFWAFNSRHTAYSGVALYVRDSIAVHGCASTLASIAALAGPAGAEAFRRCCGGREPDWPAWSAGVSAVAVVDGGAGTQGVELLPDADRGAVARAEAEGVTASLLSAEPRAAGSFTAAELDAEGRAIAVDIGGVVVINCYFPCAASRARAAFKAAFHDAVGGIARVLAASGRDVVLMGDVNASHSELDHCDPGEWVAQVLPAAARAAAGRPGARAAGLGPAAGGGADPLDVEAVSGVGEASVRAAPPADLPAEARAAFGSGVFRRWLSSLAGAPMTERPAWLAARMMARLPALPVAPAAHVVGAYDGRGSAAAVGGTERVAGADRAEDGSGAAFADAFRACHPRLRGAFSCWSEMTSARSTNYGTRIDYVLLSRRLAEGALLNATVMQSTGGSDHCPVDAVLDRAAWDRAVARAGHAPPGGRDPDDCDARRWPQFSARQSRLSSFYGAAKPGAAATAPAVAPPKPRRAGKRQASLFASLRPERSVRPRVQQPGAAPVTSGVSAPAARGGAAPGERSASEGAVAPPGERCRVTAPAAASGAQPGRAASAWRGLLKGPQPPPLCRCAPARPAVERRVVKPGPNLNRVFFVCAKPAGRKEAGGRCGFFLWGSDRSARMGATAKLKG